MNDLDLPPSDPRRYVCGFLFSVDLTNVVLIRKREPSWMRDKLNGIGGKIEAGETWHDAMAREFKEETGARVKQWHRFHREKFGNGAVVHFCMAKGDVTKPRTMTDEFVYVTDVRAGIVPFNVVYNLVYLIPMAQALLRKPEEYWPVIEETA